MKREEVLISQVVVLVLTLLTSFGVVEWGSEQFAENAGAITAGILAIYEIVASFIVRSRVTPVSDPRDNDGNSLVSAM